MLLRKVPPNRPGSTPQFPLTRDSAFCFPLSFLLKKEQVDQSSAPDLNLSSSDPCYPFPIPVPRSLFRDPCSAIPDP